MKSKPSKPNSQSEVGPNSAQDTDITQQTLSFNRINAHGFVRFVPTEATPDQTNELPLFISRIPRTIPKSIDRTLFQVLCLPDERFGRPVSSAELLEFLSLFARTLKLTPSVCDELFYASQHANDIEVAKEEIKKYHELVRHSTYNAKVKIALENEITPEQRAIALAEKLQAVLSELQEKQGVLIAYQTKDGKPFYLRFVKNAAPKQHSFAVTLVSRDAELVKSKTIEVGGKAKAYAKLVFEEVAEERILNFDWIQRLFWHQLGMKHQGATSITALLANLGEGRPCSQGKLRSIGESVTLLKNTQAFLFDHDTQYQGLHRAERRFKIQLRVYALVAHYNNVWRALGHSYTNRSNLRRAIHKIRQSLSSDVVAGYFTKDEIRAIDKKCTKIEAAIAKAVSAVPALTLNAKVWSDIECAPLNSIELTTAPAINAPNRQAMVDVSTKDTPGEYGSIDEKVFELKSHFALEGLKTITPQSYLSSEQDPKTKANVEVWQRRLADVITHCNMMISKSEDLMMQDYCMQAIYAFPCNFDNASSGDEFKFTENLPFQLTFEEACAAADIFTKLIVILATSAQKTETLFQDRTIAILKCACMIDYVFYTAEGSDERKNLLATFEYGIYIQNINLLAKFVIPFIRSYHQYKTSYALKAYTESRMVEEYKAPMHKRLRVCGEQKRAISDLSFNINAGLNRDVPDHYRDAFSKLALQEGDGHDYFQKVIEIFKYVIPKYDPISALKNRTRAGWFVGESGISYLKKIDPTYTLYNSDHWDTSYALLPLFSQWGLNINNRAFAIAAYACAIKEGPGNDRNYARRKEDEKYLTQEAMVDDPRLALKTLQKVLQDSSRATAHRRALNSELCASDLSAFLITLSGELDLQNILSFISNKNSLLFLPDVRASLEHRFLKAAMIKTSLEKEMCFLESAGAIFEDAFTYYTQLFDASIDDRDISPAIFIARLSRGLKEIAHEIVRENSGLKINSEAIKQLPKFFEKIRVFALKSIDAESKYHPFRYALLTQLLHSYSTFDKMSESQMIEFIIYHFAFSKTLISSADYDTIKLHQINHFALRNQDVFKNVLSSTTSLQYTLDTICHYLGYEIADANWKGEYPSYENPLYKINLQNHQFIDKRNQSEYIQLPGSVITHPRFRALFENENVKQLKVRQQQSEQEALFVYDLKHESGRVRRFVYDAAHRELKIYQCLQDAEIWSLYMDDTAFLDNREYVNDHDQVTPLSILAKKLPQVVASLKWFVDPKEPLVLIGTDINWQPLFQLRFAIPLIGTNIYLREIRDLRIDAEGEPLHRDKIGMLADLKRFPYLARLQGFEKLKEMILWTERGVLDEIEMPRYDLRFKIKTLPSGNLFVKPQVQLLCMGRELQKYRLKIDATPSEMKHIQGALKLVPHTDNTLPDILLVANVSLGDYIFEDKLNFTDIAYAVLMKKAPDPKKRMWVNTSKAPHSQYHTVHVRQPEDSLQPAGNRFTACTDWFQYIYKAVENHVFSPIQYVDEALQLFSELSHQYFKVETSSQYDVLRKTLDSIMHAPSNLANSNALKLKILLAFYARLPQELKNRCEDGILTAYKQYLAHAKHINRKLRLKASQQRLCLQLYQKRHPERAERLIQEQLEDTATVHAAPNNEASSASGAETSKKIRDLLKQAENREPLDNLDVVALEKRLDDSKAANVSSEMLVAERQTGGLFNEEELTELSFFDVVDSKPCPYKLDLLSESSKVEEPCVQTEMSALQEEFNDAKRLQTEGARHQLKGEKEKALLSQLERKLKEHQQRAETVKGELERHFSNKYKDAAEVLADKADYQKRISWSEMLTRYLRQDIDGIRDSLDPACDSEQVINALQHYFESEVMVKWTQCVIDTCLQMQKEDLLDDPESGEKLYEMLTRGHAFDASKHPHLMLIQYINGFIFHQKQIQLVSDALKDPNLVKQAVTGSGKTSVIMVLLALLKADGTKLITLKFLDPLIASGLKQMQGIVGDFMRRHVLSLRYKASTPIVREVTVAGERQSVSLFKEMYESLLRAILAKACVITDRKSEPLLEAKFIALLDKVQTQTKDDLPISALDKQHLTYLAKILTLLKTREHAIYDEHDKLLAPKEEIHLRLGQFQTPPRVIWETALDIFDMLIANKELGLRQNLQAHKTPEEREAILNTVAAQFADFIIEKYSEQLTKEHQADLTRYLQGKHEKILDILDQCGNNVLKDTCAVAKDYFQLYLPSTLAKKNREKYIRSSDGIHTIPTAFPNVERVGAEFEDIRERICFMVADYYDESTGVSFDYFKQWALSLKRDAVSKQIEHNTKNSDAPITLEMTTAGQTFASFLPDTPLASLSSQRIEDLHRFVNSKTELVRRFLSLELPKLQISIERISIDAHNQISISQAATGLSASRGCVDGLHRRFNRENAIEKNANGVMALRFLSRLEDDTVQAYNPHNASAIVPALLDIDRADVVIDGAADLCGTKPDIIAAQINDKRDDLKSVRYFDEHGHEHCHGDHHASLDETGFYYPAAQARGADKKLSPGLKALLLASGRANIEELSQQEGRLRDRRIRMRVAVPGLTGIETVSELFRGAAVANAKTNSDLLYRSMRQGLRDVLRAEMLGKLIKKTLDADYSSLLALFEQFDTENILVTRKQVQYSNPGDYYRQHRELQKAATPPLEALDELSTQYLDVATTLDLKNAVTYFEKPLIKAHGIEKLTKQLPANVFVPSSAELGCEVHLEVEQDVAIQIEQDVEVQQQSVVDKEEGEKHFFKWREHMDEKFAVHSLQKVKDFYDDNLMFTENHLPLKRKEWAPPSSLPRRPHDRLQNRLEYILIEKRLGHELKLTVYDQLDAVTQFPVLKERRDFDHPTEVYQVEDVKYLSLYDTRTRRQISEVSFSHLDTRWKAERCDINGKEKQTFLRGLVQLRFEDGQYDGYTQDEVTQLQAWLQEHSDELDEIETYFTQDVLKNRSEDQLRYPHSQLAKLMGSLKQGHASQPAREPSVEPDPSKKDRPKSWRPKGKGPAMSYGT